MLSGEAIVLGDDISADDISPTVAFSDEPEKIKNSCFLSLMPSIDLKDKVIVAGRRFGWGSYRESAALCLLYSGVKAVIARSFGYGMYRNLINLGIPALIGDIWAEDGDIIRIDPEGRKAYIGKKEYDIEISDIALHILKNGGLMDVP